METPEQLIAAMTSDELMELLGEMGFEATESQADAIKSLVSQLGSLEQALDAIESFETEVRRVA